MIEVVPGAREEVGFRESGPPETQFSRNAVPNKVVCFAPEISTDSGWLDELFCVRESSVEGESPRWKADSRND